MQKFKNYCHLEKRAFRVFSGLARRAKNKDSRTKLQSSFVPHGDLTRFSLVRDSARPRRSVCASKPPSLLTPPLPSLHAAALSIGSRSPPVPECNQAANPGALDTSANTHSRVHTYAGARARTFIIGAGAVIIIERR